MKQSIEYQNINDILKERGLNAALFDLEYDISFNSDIRQHIAWVYQHICSIPYNWKNWDPNNPSEGPARPIHGILHSARVAILVNVWANFFKRYEALDALSLTWEKILLLMLAAIFHDTGRKAEGEDYWDKESAIFLYCYLTKVLKMPSQIAKEAAEWIANKDAEKNGTEDEYDYYELVIETEGSFGWKKTKSSKKKIEACILHDADSQDIAREKIFDGIFLDFYKQVAKNNPIALEEIAKLRTEMQSWLSIQGDLFSDENPALKKQYENENAYDALIQSIDPTRHPLLNQMKSFPCDDSLNLFPYSEIENLAREGKLLFRGIIKPTQIAMDPVSKKQFLNEKTNKLETRCDFELRKIQRKKGVETRSKKSDRAKKEGFPGLSTSRIGYGAPVYACQGYMVPFDIEKVAAVFNKNAFTGFGKKPIYKFFYPSLEDIEKNQANLCNLHHNLQLSAKSHNEIIYRATDYTGVIYTLERCAADPYDHPYQPPLNAIYLQQNLEKNLKKTVPIYKYSSIHDFLEPCNFKEEEIISMWVTLCKDFLETYASLFEENKLRWAHVIKNMSIEKIKLYATNGYHCNPITATLADEHYEDTLRCKINEKIALLHKDLVDHSLSEHHKEIENLHKKLQEKGVGNEIDALVIEKHFQLITKMLNHQAFLSLWGKFVDLYHLEQLEKCYLIEYLLNNAVLFFQESPNKKLLDLNMFSLSSIEFFFSIKAKGIEKILLDLFSMLSPEYAYLFDQENFQKIMRKWAFEAYSKKLDDNTSIEVFSQMLIKIEDAQFLKSNFFCETIFKCSLSSLMDSSIGSNPINLLLEMCNLIKDDPIWIENNYAWLSSTSIIPLMKRCEFTNIHSMDLAPLTSFNTFELDILLGEIDKLLKKPSLEGKWIIHEEDICFKFQRLKSVCEEEYSEEEFSKMFSAIKHFFTQIAEKNTNGKDIEFKRTNSNSFVM